jgi:hypothetical protein
MFTYFRLIFEKVNPLDTVDTSIQIAQFKIWGVPLQDLDGSLVLQGGYLTPVSHPANNSYVYHQGSTIKELTQDSTQPVENPNLGAAVLADGAPVTGPYQLDGYRVEASSIRSLSFIPTRAFNKDYGDKDDIWLSDEPLPVWLGITYPESTVCTHYSIRSRNLPDFIRYPKAWTLQGLSLDIGHWIILDERTETSWGANVLKEYTVSKSFPCSSYRLYITDVDIPSASPITLVAIAQWRLFTTPARQDHDTIYMLPGSVEENPNLGSATIASGGTTDGPYELDGFQVRSSSHYISVTGADTMFFPHYAFNKTIGSGPSDSWSSKAGVSYPHWIQIRYPHTTTLTSYSVTSRTQSIEYVRPPNDWTVQGSHDGMEWTVIDEQMGQGAALQPGGVTIQYSVSSSTAYQYYRMHITDSIDEPTFPDMVNVGEWRLFTTPNQGLGKLLAKNTLQTQSKPGTVRVPNQMPVQAVSYQDLVSLISVSRRDLVVNSGKTSITDQSSGQEWNYGGSAALVLEDGVPCVDLSAGALTLNGTGATLGQEYTLVYYWKPLVGATTWRTLHQNESLEWLVLISRFGDFVELGTYTARGAAEGFRGTGYNINPGVWQTLIVTNTGDTVTSNIGTGTFYVNDNQVGTTDRVGCGTTLTYLGRYSTGTQPPGHVAVAGVFNRILNRKEITKVHRLLERWGQGQYTQQIPKSIGNINHYSLPSGLLRDDVTDGGRWYAVKYMYDTLTGPIQSENHNTSTNYYIEFDRIKKLVAYASDMLFREDSSQTLAKFASPSAFQTVQQNILNNRSWFYNTHGNNGSTSTLADGWLVGIDGNFVPDAQQNGCNNYSTNGIDIVFNSCGNANGSHTHLAGELGKRRLRGGVYTTAKVHSIWFRIP